MNEKEQDFHEFSEYWFVSVQLSQETQKQLILGRRDRSKPSYRPDIDLWQYGGADSRNGVSQEHLLFQLQNKTFQVSPLAIGETYHNQIVVTPGTTYQFDEGDSFQMGNVCVIVELTTESKNQGRTNRRALMKYVGQGEPLPSVEQLTEKILIPELNQSYPAWIIQEAEELMDDETSLSEALEIVLDDIEAQRNSVPYDPNTPPKGIIFITPRH